MLVYLKICHQILKYFYTTSCSWVQDNVSSIRWICVTSSYTMFTIPTRSQILFEKHTVVYTLGKYPQNLVSSCHYLFLKSGVFPPPPGEMGK